MHSDKQLKIADGHTHAHTHQAGSTYHTVARLDGLSLLLVVATFADLCLFLNSLRRPHVVALACLLSFVACMLMTIGEGGQ